MYLVLKIEQVETLSTRHNDDPGWIVYIFWAVKTNTHFHPNYYEKCPGIKKEPACFESQVKEIILIFYDDIIYPYIKAFLRTQVHHTACVLKHQDMNGTSECAIHIYVKHI